MNTSVTTPKTAQALRRPCPCGQPRTYAVCCAPLHGGALAPTAEALMRSRYSAYALGLHAYVLRTWHPSTRPPAIEPANGTRWIALRVLSHTELDATHAEVAFEATARIQGRATTMRELSRFERADGAVDGAWLYVDAVVVPG